MRFLARVKMKMRLDNYYERRNLGFVKPDRPQNLMTNHLLEPPLTRFVPLSRFTSRVGGGGSAFCVI
jgi:hypothetical protein